jgi:H+/Cl- antiporter ClcA
MPSGDSPEKARQFFEYLQGHHETDYRVATWTVDWMSLAWLWGFVAVITLGLLLWVWQYRTTRQRTGIYPVDSFGGYTTEMAGPSTFWFLALTLFLTLFAVAIIVGHIVFGQKF